MRRAILLFHGFLAFMFLFFFLVKVDMTEKKEKQEWEILQDAIFSGNKNETKRLIVEKQTLGGLCGTGRFARTALGHCV